MTEYHHHGHSYFNKRSHSTGKNHMAKTLIFFKMCWHLLKPSRSAALVLKTKIVIKLVYFLGIIANRCQATNQRPAVTWPATRIRVDTCRVVTVLERLRVHLIVKLAIILKIWITTRYVALCHCTDLLGSAKRPWTLTNYSLWAGQICPAANS